MHALGNRTSIKRCRHGCCHTVARVPLRHGLFNGRVVGGGLRHGRGVGGGLSGEGSLQAAPVLLQDLLPADAAERGDDLSLLGHLQTQARSSNESYKQSRRNTGGWSVGLSPHAERLGSPGRPGKEKGP
eukprot:1193014-Prorocentrum_minimum.AAC.2